MAQTSIFWATESVGDGAGLYSQAQLFTWLRTMLHGDPASQGVVWDYPPTGPQNLTATVSGTNVLLAPGAAVVYGIPYWSDDTETIPIPVPVVGTTGHRVVVRADYVAQTVRLALLSSADGVSALPALTQTLNTTWEIPLYGVQITTGGSLILSDQRVYAEHRAPYVKRQGDIVTGLAVQPRLDVYNPEEIDDQRRWRIEASAMPDPGLKIGTVADDGLSGFAPFFKVTRIGTALDEILLGGGGTTVKDGGGNVFWHDGLLANLRRQGETDWSGWGESPTNSSLSLKDLLIQFGTALTNSSGNFTVTFPAAFSAKPWVLVVPVIQGFTAGAGTTTLTTVQVATSDGTSAAQAPFRWLAIGLK